MTTTAVVVMGVAGSGKSTVGVALAALLGADFVDADDLHPAANIEKMTSGLPLTDEDRWPWLARVGDVIAERSAAGRPVVVACSALRRSYRDAIRRQAGTPVFFAHLDGTRSLIEKRMSERENHFMPPALLASQLDLLEPLGPDEFGAVVDTTTTPQDIASAVAAAVQLT